MDWPQMNFHKCLDVQEDQAYHDRGIVYLLPEVGHDFDGESEEAKSPGFT